MKWAGTVLPHESRGKGVVLSMAPSLREYLLIMRGCCTGWSLLVVSRGMMVDRCRRLVPSD